MSRRGRGGVALAIAFLLGAITTLAVAWAFAAWGRTDGDGPRSSGAFVKWDRGWSVTRVLHIGVRVHWWSNLVDDQPVRSPAAFLQALAPPRPASEVVAERREHIAELSRGGRTLYPVSVDHEPPAWGTFTGPPLWEAARIGSDTAFGWPAPRLWYQVIAGFNRVTMSTVNDTLHGGILLRGAPESRAGTFRALPLRPIWWGLLVNTLVFGLLWGVLLLGPPAARRAVRRRLGRCARCGYDLRGQTAPGCPECGAGRA